MASEPDEEGEGTACRALLALHRGRAAARTAGAGQRSERAVMRWRSCPSSAGEALQSARLRQRGRFGTVADPLPDGRSRQVAAMKVRVASLRPV